MMRISCCWIYAISKYGYPTTIKDACKALQEMRELGFRYQELEGIRTENTQEVYENRRMIKRFCKDRDITLINFSAVLPDLFATDAKTAARGLDDFKKSIEIACDFEAGSIQVDSFTPPLRFKGVQPYAEEMAYDQNFAVEIDPYFCWESYYDKMVNVYRQCAELAAASGKLVIVEPRVGENIYSTDSFLRLYDHVQHSNLGVVLDAAHLNAAKEILAYSVEKLNKKIFSVHAADNDSRTNLHLTVGDGNIDWDGVFTALNKHGFNGYIAIDVANIPNLEDAFVKSKNFLIDTLKRLNIAFDV